MIQKKKLQQQDQQEQDIQAHSKTKQKLNN
jgi:hypothetical protein